MIFQDASFVTHTPRNRWSAAAPNRLLIFAALVTMIGAALAFTYLVETPSSARARLRDRSANVATGRAYQFAVDELLRTGDSTELQRVLAPDFVEHNPVAGLNGDVGGLIALLEVLRQAAPGLAYQATQTELTGSDIAFQVRVIAPADVALPPRPDASVSHEWQFSERIRIGNGQVLERWGPDLPFPLVMQTTSWQGDARGNGGTFRVSAFAGAGTHVRPTGPTLLAVRRGIVRVQATNGVEIARAGSRDRAVSEQSTDVTAQAGDLLYADGGFLFTADEEAVLFVVRLVIPDNRSNGTSWATYDEEPSQESTGQQVVTLQNTGELVRMLEFAQTEPLASLAVSRIAYALPADSRVLLPPDAPIQIVTVTAGSIAMEPSGAAVNAGETLFIGPELRELLLLATSPAAVEVVSVQIEGYSTAD